MSQETSEQLVQTTREVMDWLKTKYVNVPPFEVNEKSMNILLKVKRASEASTQNVSLINEDLGMKSKEYQAETNRMRKIVDHLSITPQRLSHKGRTAMRNLSSTSYALELRKPSRTSFLLALTEASREHSKVEMERVQKEEMAKQLADATVQTWLKVQHLRNVKWLFEEELITQSKENKQLAKDIPFLKTKIKNYEADIARLDEKYKMTGMEESLTHQTLQAKMEDLNKSKVELSTLSEKLKSYQDLPLSLELAKVKLEELKVQLEDVDREIFELIPVGIV